MQVIDNIADFRKLYQHCVATIGKYDGLHLGHQQILSRLKAKAALFGLPSLVILSEPQPDEFFLGAAAPPRLSSFRDKTAFLQDFGIDLVYRMNFDQRLSQLPASSFISEILLQGLGIRALVVGDDFRFGKDRQGDLQLLQAAGKEAGFVVEALGACLSGRERVSSTLVREKLQQGDCEAARTLLGRYYSLGGEVVKGRQLGRQLGFPTANVQLEIERPALGGIFAVQVCRAGHNEKLPGLANLGCRPTVNGGDNKVALEVFLPDFSGDLYGSYLTVSFIRKLRDEVRFASMTALKEAMDNDLQQARQIFSGWQDAENA